MTITQLRNEFKARIRFDELTKSGLADYLKQEWETLEKQQLQITERNR